MADTICIWNVLNGEKIICRPIRNKAYKHILPCLITTAEDIHIYNTCIKVCQVLKLTIMIICTAPLHNIHSKFKTG